MVVMAAVLLEASGDLLFGILLEALVLSCSGLGFSPSLLAACPAISLQALTAHIPALHSSPWHVGLLHQVEGELVCASLVPIFFCFRKDDAVLPLRGSAVQMQDEMPLTWFWSCELTVKM